MTRLSALVDNERIAFTGGKLTWLASMSAQHDALVSAAQSPGLRNTYPIAYYTPESPQPGSPVGALPLTDANFAQSVRNAIAAAQNNDGGTVLIPPGTWRPCDLVEEEIELVSAGRGKGVTIAGGGAEQTTILLPTGYSGTLFYFNADSDFYYGGGMRDLTIRVESEDASNDGIAVLLVGAVYPVFEHVVIRNFTGGSGFKTRSRAPDFTNQYVQLHDVTVTGCYINYDLTAFVNSMAYGCFSASAVHRDYLLDESKAIFFGGNIQSTAPVLVEMAGNGGCQIAFHGYYYEGFAPTIFKCGVPSVTSNRLEVYGLHLGGTPTTFLDVDAFTAVSLHYVNLILNATTVLKARNGPAVTMIGCTDPTSSPGVFDLDSASRATLTCIGPTGNYFYNATIPNDLTVGHDVIVTRDVTGGRNLTAGGNVIATVDVAAGGDVTVGDDVIAGGDIAATGNVTAGIDVIATRDLSAARTIKLPSFATGAETSTAAGSLSRDSTYDRPTFRTGSAYNRLAFRTDDNDLTALLSPYAAEVFDPAIYRLRTVIAGELDVLLGFINGSSLAAPSSSQRPTWNTTDEYFGGRPSFKCALTGNYYLQGTLAVPVAVSSRPALFAVYRCEPGINDAANRRLAILAEHAADHSSDCAIGQSDLNESNTAYGYIHGPGGYGYGIGATGTDAYGHVAYMCSDSGVGTKYFRDAEAQSPSTGDPGLNATTIDRATLGGAWTGAAYAGCNIVVAYAAVLNAPLDEDTRVKAVRAAMSRYSLR